MKKFMHHVAQKYLTCFSQGKLHPKTCIERLESFQCSLWLQRSFGQSENDFLKNNPDTKKALHDAKEAIFEIELALNKEETI